MSNRTIWAKRSRETSITHPLICHMIDTAAVAHRLWTDHLAPAMRRRLAGALGLPEEVAGRWIAFLVGLHDLGKASPGFQAGSSKRPPHGMITAKLLSPLLRELGFPPITAMRCAVCIGGHHGVFPRSNELAKLSPAAVGEDALERARQALRDDLLDACGLRGVAAPSAVLTEDHIFFVILAGLTTVADWIASNERRFPYVGEQVDLDAYIDGKQGRAAEALSALGWTGLAAPHRNVVPFADLFGFSPNVLQRAIVDLARRLTEPALVLLEAPMGTGKTEAAFSLAHHAEVVLGQPGFYFALPSQATSNQMFTRTEEYLARRHAGDTVNLQLLHGHAALSAEFDLIRKRADHLVQPTGVGDDQAPAVVAAEWFTYRKRGLLSRFGVGTVDQALLSVIQTKHFFVRLFGLAHKTVIIDEVHAYDAFTSEILELLITWLAALGCSVVLLSATLPAKRSRELLAAYAKGAGTDTVAEPSDGYPRVTWQGASDRGSIGLEMSKDELKRVGLKRVNGRLPASESDPFILGERLRSTLQNGGCVAVICSTVRRAQRVFRALQRYFPLEELDLFHAQFLFAEREKREKRTLERFCKKGQRPHRMVVVATQVVEQSLDLDFDVIVTDMAPLDLLLQRAGRLWRHDGNDRHGLPRELWICEPERWVDGVIPRFGRGTEAVYDRHLLLRSWLALLGREEFVLPSCIQPLVEAVYGETDLATADQRMIEELNQTAANLAKKRRELRNKAAVQLIDQPDWADEIMERFNTEREEDDPSVHLSVQAKTRPGVSVSVVCLTEPLPDLSRVPEMEEIKTLLYRTVSISSPGLVAYLVEHGEVPAGWQQTALLRHHRSLVVGAGGRVTVGGWHLELDPDLGLVITSPQKGGESIGPV